MADKPTQEALEEARALDIKPWEPATVALALDAFATRRVAEERGRCDCALAIVGKLQAPIVNVDGWVRMGCSETTHAAIEHARDDGWSEMGWRQFLEADRALPIPPASTPATGERNARHND